MKRIETTRARARIRAAAVAGVLLPFLFALSPIARAGEVTILKFADEAVETSGGTIVVFAPVETVKDIARGVRKGSVDSVRLGEVVMESCVSEGNSLVRGKTTDGRAVMLVGAD